MDYRYLNQGTIKNNYPLSLISQLINCLKGCNRFTKLDLQWGYNNIRIKDSDEWKVAFVIGRGAYESLVLFFGACNGPGMFQQMMNDLFMDMLAKFLIVFMDDMLIKTKQLTDDEHMNCIQQVLQRLCDNNLFLN